MAYKAVLTNPLPKGSIDTTGTFGPWQREDPGSTPLTGSYTFDNVDLCDREGDWWPPDVDRKIQRASWIGSR